MKGLIPYLMFPGSCREALKFYKTCLNGEITKLETVENSPLKLADEHKDRIFDSEFIAENIRFKASDDDPNRPVPIGRNFSMFVEFSVEVEQKQAFADLAEGGQVLFPLEHGFGMLVDKFNIQWMLAFNPK